MPAASLSLTIEAGADWSTSFVYEVGTPPAPVDLSRGWQAHVFFWDLNGPKVHLQSSTASLLGDITLGSDGSIGVHLTLMGTTAIVSSGEWLLVLIDSDGKPSYLIRGPLFYKAGGK